MLSGPLTVSFIPFWYVDKYKVISIVAKIPESLVGIQLERSVSLSSDRKIRDHRTSGGGR